MLIVLVHEIYILNNVKPQSGLFATISKCNYVPQQRTEQSFRSQVDETPTFQEPSHLGSYEYPCLS